jgi:RNA polymerase sigma-70 factor (ECF subfamily)
MDLSDPATFSGIYDEYARGVQATALRVLGNAVQAQDVTQDVFMRVWRNPEKFDAGRGEIGSYLRLMARSRAVDLWREGQAAGRAGDRLKVVAGQAQPGVGERPERVALQRCDRGTIGAALRGLPETQREALVLAYWGDLTADQIARRAGVPLGTVKSRIRLGLSKLRSELDESATQQLVAA